ncbi:MAG TPA: TolC family protein [Candidatus Acidoferrales bacterium]|nr:TolC family protein [Candidatus Acidoferrales bacterium]
MKNYIFLCLVIPALSFAQSDTLTLEHCVQIALKHNPSIRIAEGGLESSESNLELSRSALYPQISAQAALTRNGGTIIVGNRSINGFFDNYTTGLQAQQLVFDFGKTITRVSGSADLVDASDQNSRASTEDIILNTYISYYDYLAAERVREVDSETVQQAADHLKQAQAFYKAGTAPQYDVVNAEVTLANANVSLIQAENNLKITRVQLENAIGQQLPDNFLLSDILEVSYVKIDVQAAIDTALRSRPELLSSQAQVQAGKQFLASAWTANLPSIYATGGYNWRNLNPSPLYPGWNIGVTLSLPIFQGFALDAGIDQARANLKTAEASNDLVIQSLLLDVQQQEFALEEASESIQASRKLVEQASEALRLAVARYNSGIGTALEETDAQVALANARIAYIQSLYNYSVSYARLERAMGTIK